MHWDGTVTLGNVITLAGMVAAVLGTFYSMRGRLDFIIRCIAQHDGSIAELTKISREHERELASLSAQVFRRRREDPES